MHSCVSWNVDAQGQSAQERAPLPRNAVAGVVRAAPDFNIGPISGPGFILPDSAPKARQQDSLGVCRTYREAVKDLSPGLPPISANLIVIARRLIVPEGLMRVAWHEVPGMA
jgi:hypothetical protein